MYLLVCTQNRHLNFNSTHCAGVSHNLSMTLLQQVNIVKNVKNRRKTSITGGFTTFNVFASLIIHKKIPDFPDFGQKTTFFAIW